METPTLLENVRWTVKITRTDRHVAYWSGASQNPIADALTHTATALERVASVDCVPWNEDLKAIGEEA